MDRHTLDAPCQLEDDLEQLHVRMVALLAALQADE